MVWKNELQTIDLSGLTHLEYLDASSNQLSSISSLELNTTLWGLVIHDNKLISLNLKGLTKLTRLQCWANKLINLDISTSNNLESLLYGISNVAYEEGNRITKMDIMHLKKLGHIDCAGNKIGYENLSKYGAGP